MEVKKWFVMTALCMWGICLTISSAVLVGAQTEPAGTAAQMDGTSGEGVVEDSYQAPEAGTNAQGQRIIPEPLWEYSGPDRAYRLVKSRNAQGLSTYFTSEDGILQLGRTSGHLYAFDEQGDMITGLRKINGAWYYLTPREKAEKTTDVAAPDHTTVGMAVRDRWIKKDDGAWWYFDSVGRYDSVRIGSRKIDGSYYYLRKNGIPCEDCFKTVDKKKYYYGEMGVRADYVGWKTINEKKYYFNRKHYVEIKTGWRKIGGARYYFGPRGRMYAQRWLNAGGKRYYFKKSGEMAVGWAEYKGTYYYFKKSGELERNTIGKSGGTYYLVNAKGARGADILKGVGIKASMSRAQKLRACFDYVVRRYTYMPAEVWPPKGWEPYHAYRIMITKRGNCYDYAAAFCYLARAVGYKDMACVAGERSDETGGYRPHGWCVYRGRVFDPRLTYPDGTYPYDTAYRDLPHKYRK